MRRVLAKLLLIFSPGLLLLLFYLYKDPYKVLYHYKNYFLDSPHIFIEEEVVSTGTFRENYKDYKYDSYIFGSSRSMVYKSYVWRNYIHSDRCFHFDSFNESLYGMTKKLEYIQKTGLPIKNALFIMDHTVFGCVTNDPWSTEAKSPYLTGDSWVAFQSAFARRFFYSNYLRTYVNFLITGKADYTSAIFVNFPFKYNGVANEGYLDFWETSLQSNPDSFYNSKADQFLRHDSANTYFAPTLGKKQRELLAEMKKILDKDSTHFRIVISPLYDQLKIDTNDLKYLCETFGKDRVFDFSGVNDFTKSKYNYYEPFHYRPFIANKILETIYK